MRKFLFFLPLTLIFNLKVNGQSITFNDLVYYSGMQTRQIYDTFMKGNAFRQNYTTEVDGQTLTYFKSIANKTATEQVIAGHEDKTGDAKILKSIEYTSTDPDNILNMLAQAKKYGLVQRFRGADADNNIYLLDNDYYHVVIHLRRDQKSGTVEIFQKLLLVL